MVTVIHELTAIRDHIAEILKTSGYRNDYIANKHSFLKKLYNLVEVLWGTRLLTGQG
jgi:predicted house-cleaning noncanonical NTP pyrophosphatase (MazG superfamily)